MEFITYERLENTIKITKKLRHAEIEIKLF